MYIIDKVIKGTEKTFCNFLKALEESEDESNHNLMTDLQHHHQAKGRMTHCCKSKMPNTLSSRFNARRTSPCRISSNKNQ